MPDRYRVVICSARTPGEAATMTQNAVAYWTNKQRPYRLVSNNRGPDEIEVRRAKAGDAYDDDVEYEFSAPDGEFCVILVFERQA